MMPVNPGCLWNTLLITYPARANKPHTWQGGPQSKPTVVTWTLELVGTATRVRLEQIGFEGLGGLAVSFMLGRGWRSKVLRQLRIRRLNLMSTSWALRSAPTTRSVDVCDLT